jgi:hypothetical protein
MLRAARNKSRGQRQKQQRTSSSGHGDAQPAGSFEGAVVAATGAGHEERIGLAHASLDESSRPRKTHKGQWWAWRHSLSGFLHFPQLRGHVILQRRVECDLTSGTYRNDGQRTSLAMEARAVSWTGDSL